VPSRPKQLAELLDLAENGEEIIITRHGKQVARLGPIQKPFDREAARQAVEDIKKMRKGMHIDDATNQGTHQRGSPLICVIDASVTLSWVFTDEHSATSDALLAQVADQGAVVPALWRLETPAPCKMASNGSESTPHTGFSNPENSSVSR